jgi:hypothetical protein
MDNDVKQGFAICGMLVFMILSIVGVAGLFTNQIHRQKVEIYSVVSKCRQQSPQNADVVCGPFPKFEN